MDSLKIINMYKDGKTAKEISLATGSSLSNVYNILHASGVFHKNRKWSSSMPREKIIEMLLSGKSQSEVAKEVNVSRQYVNGIARQCGILGTKKYMASVMGTGELITGELVYVRYNNVSITGILKSRGGNIFDGKPTTFIPVYRESVKEI